MLRLLVMIPIAALLFVGSAACATKGFVRTNVGEVNQRVDSLENSLEETQEQTKQNESRIGQVAEAAQSAQQSAQQATELATDATSLAKSAGAKAEALDKAGRLLVNDVVLTEAQGDFKFERTELPDGAAQKLDELVARLKKDPKNLFIEIEGYTDSSGSEEVNEKIGLERAESVQRYLHERHQIPLHRMNVISYGEDNPVAPNTTREGRAQNRRVVIRVLT
jgi:outer membrane protein OmpA-like peptidoglycan-associated protein